MSLLMPVEIGDNLDLEKEATYPRSDGSYTSTISVDKLLEAQHALDAVEINELKEQIDFMHEAYEVMVDIQEQECQQRVKEIFEELRRHSSSNNSGTTEIMFYGCTYQFFEAEYLKEEIVDEE